MTEIDREYKTEHNRLKKKRTNFFDPTNHLPRKFLISKQKKILEILIFHSVINLEI